MTTNAQTMMHKHEDKALVHANGELTVAHVQMLLACTPFPVPAGLLGPFCVEFSTCLHGFPPTLQLASTLPHFLVVCVEFSFNKLLLI